MKARPPASIASVLFHCGFGVRAQRLYLHWWRSAIATEAYHAGRLDGVIAIRELIAKEPKGGA